MTTQKAPPARKPVAPPAAPRRPPAPGARRPLPPAPRRRGRGGGGDRFGFYFVFLSVVGIFLFGAAVWGLRSLNRATPAPAATATATVETVSVLPRPTPEGTPLSLTPLPTLTLPAPDALKSGAFATTAPLTSIVTDTAAMAKPASLPAGIPQAHVDLSTTDVNLGSVGAAGVLTQEVTLANPGAADLVILRMGTDCACLTARAEAGKLRSGTRTRLLLTYNSAQDAATHGAVAHTLVLATTDGQNPLTTINVTATRP